MPCAPSSVRRLRRTVSARIPAATHIDTSVNCDSCALESWWRGKIRRVTRCRTMDSIIRETRGLRALPVMRQHRQCLRLTGVRLPTAIAYQSTWLTSDTAPQGYQSPAPDTQSQWTAPVSNQPSAPQQWNQQQQQAGAYNPGVYGAMPGAYSQTQQVYCYNIVIM